MRDGERISGEIPGLFAVWSCRVDGFEDARIGSAKFIGPASANGLGTANAIASTIVVSFMDVSFSTG
jgi:hypothetical protein